MCMRQSNLFAFALVFLQRPLQQPVVLDPLGKLINKDALLEYLLDRTTYGDGKSVCGYIQGMKVSNAVECVHVLVHDVCGRAYFLF